MRYKHIKVDMDYCADPLWVSEDGICFANGSLTEFESTLSTGLLQGLCVYQTLWEKANWSKYMSPTDQENLDWIGEELIWDTLNELQVVLAAKLKEELPDVHVYIPHYSECSNPSWQLIEIGNNKISGIKSTLVG